jgi:hypothetical protein
MKFLEAQETIEKELRVLEADFSSRTDYSRNYMTLEYHNLRTMRDSFNMVDDEEDLNLLYNKSDGLKFNQIYQYKLLQKYKELMKEDFPKLWH